MRAPAWLLVGTFASAIAGAGCQQARSAETKAVSQARSLMGRLTGSTGMASGETHLVSKGLRERGNGFIGEIRFTVTRPGRAPHTVDYSVQEGKVRYDVLDSHGRPTSFAVADLPARKAFAVLGNTGSVVPIAPITGPGDPPRDLDDAVILRRPDRTAHVAGRLCEKWNISTTDHDVQVCAVSGISWFDLLPRWNSDHVQPKWSAELSRDRYFPLRVIVRDKRGHEELRMQATQVHEGPVDASRFELPARANVVAAIPGRTLPSAT